MGSWKKVIVSGSDANLKSLVVSQSLSATSITGSLLGSAQTASYVQFNYSRELHVSVNGSDSTGDGTFLFPFRTIIKALDSASSAVQIVVHPGTYAESPTVSGSASNVTITATNAEIGGIVEISGSLTINQFSASTKVVGLAINNIIHTGSQNLYLQNVTVRSGVSKTGNGYLEANKILCQSPATFNVTAAGTVVVQNSLLGVVTVNNASANVNLSNNISMVTPTCTLGTLLIDGGVIYSTGNTTGAVFSGAGSAVVLSNLVAFTPSNTPARISLNAASGYSIQNVAYDKANSTLGVSLRNKTQFQHIQADAVTGSLYGTASYADTSSYVIYNYVTQSLAVTASYSTSASYTDGGPFFKVSSKCDILGTEVEVGNIKAKIASTNSASIQLRTISGSITVDGMQPGGFNTVNQVTRIEGLGINTTYAYVDANTNMQNPGDSQIFTFIERSTGASYRVTGLVSQGFSKNLISIEKLV